MPSDKVVEIIANSMRSQANRQPPIIDSDIPHVSRAIAEALETANCLVRDRVGVVDTSQPETPPATNSLSSLASKPASASPEFATIEAILQFSTSLIKDAQALAALKPKGAPFLSDVAQSATEIQANIVQRNRWTPKQEAALRNWRAAIDRWSQ